MTPMQIHPASTTANNANSGNNRIHWCGFSVCLLIAIAALGSWLYPVTRTVWDAIDQTVFFSLNGTLATPSGWSLMWAVLNWRAMDLLPLSLLLPFLLVPDLVIERQQRIRACCHLFIIIVVMLVVRTVFDNVTEVMAWRGNSPSITLEPSYRLSQMYPNLDMKDRSSQSFPGDHSAVLMIVASFLLLQRLNPWSLLATGIATLFILPRLVAGAHWFSDAAVGGVFIATVSMALGFFTNSPRLWASELAGRIRQHPLTPGWLR